MQFRRQKYLIVPFAFLIWGLISCSPEKKSATPVVEGMLVNAPVILHADQSKVRFNDIKEDALVSLNMDDRLLLSPVVNQKALVSMQVESRCKVGGETVSRDNVTLAFSDNFLVSRFFTPRTLFNDSKADATSLDCQLHFKVIADSGSTHSFSLPHVQLQIKYTKSSPIQAMMGEKPASQDTRNQIRINYNNLNKYHFNFDDKKITSAELMCEAKTARLSAESFGRSLDFLKFEPRNDVAAEVANEKNATQQFCRMFGYSGDGSVEAVSDLIVMRMTAPELTITRVPPPPPKNIIEANSVYARTRRDFAIFNPTSYPVTIAIPTGAALLSHVKVQLLNYYYNGQYWDEGNLPTQVIVMRHPYIMNGSYVALTIGSGESVQVATELAPNDFHCDPIHQVVGFEDDLIAPEVTYFVVQNASAPIHGDNILYTDRLEPQFSIHVNTFRECTDQICRGHSADGWHDVSWIPFTGKPSHECTFR